MNTILNSGYNSINSFYNKQNEKFLLPKDNHFIKNQSDYVTFTARPNLKNIPVDIIQFDALNSSNPNILKEVTTGMFSKIIKYLSPQNKNFYAVKVPWQQSAEDMQRLDNEIKALEQLKHIDEVPHVVHKKLSLKSPSYMFMSWLKGSISSKDSVHYNLDLINNENLGNLFKTLNKMDEAGIEHNDLWSQNLLFDKSKVNVIDFDTATIFNPKTDYKINNLSNFKKKFLHPYFEDVYERLGEKAYLNIYQQMLKAESSYYKSKQLYYLKCGNIEAFKHYCDIDKNISEQLKNPEQLKFTAINVVFHSNVSRGDLFARYLGKEGKQACICYKRALNILAKNKNIADFKNADLLLANISVISKLKKASQVQGQERFDRIKEAYSLLKNETIYTKEEREKPYYEQMHSFIISLL